jgi:hypothetical protein
MNRSSMVTTCKWPRTAIRCGSTAGWIGRKCLARLAEPLKTIPCRTAVIDGELVVPDIRGTADFTGLAGALASDEDVTARTQD